MSKSVIKRSSTGSAIYAFKEGKQALLSIENAPKAQHKASSTSTEEEEGKNFMIPWGVNNDFPKVLAKLMRKTTVGRAGLQLLTKSIYGQRLMTYKVIDVENNGQEVIQSVRVPEWEQIIQRSNFNMVRLGLIQDYAYFGINFPEIRMNGNKSGVWAIDYHKASHVRFAPADKNGVIPNVFVSGNFPEAKESDCQNIKMIDPIRFYDQIESIKKNTTTFKYVMPQLWPDVLNDYYPVVYWDSSRESGWLDIVTSIPAFKKALFKNQMSLKYDVKIPMQYLEDLYPGFRQWDLEKQDEKIDELIDEINNNLTGAENSAKSIVSFTYTDKHTGKQIGGFEIKTIDDKMRTDAYLPDAAAGNAEILFSMLINPAQVGQGNTGGDYSGGANNGGSNIRESGLFMRSLLKADRDINNGIFEFVKAYHGIDPEIQIAIQDSVLTTLDTGSGSKKIVS